MKQIQRDLYWWASLSDNQKHIYEKLETFHPFFADMLFQEDSASYDLVAVTVNDQFESITELPPQIEYFAYEYYNVRIRRRKGCEGSYNRRTQTLTVDPSNLTNDSVILHEMIHLHEHVIEDSLPKFYYDAVLWSLYKQLRNHIPKIDEIIDTHAHVLNSNDIAVSGGSHDLLFLLKSFDLDIRMNYSLGTVFAYGYADTFKKYVYTPYQS